MIVVYASGDLYTVIANKWININTENVKTGLREIVFNLKILWQQT